MKKRTMVYLPPDLHEELKLLAEEHDRSQAQEIVTGLKSYIRSLKKREAQYERRLGPGSKDETPHSAGFDYRAP